MGNPGTSDVIHIPRVSLPAVLDIGLANASLQPLAMANQPPYMLMPQQSLYYQYQPVPGPSTGPHTDARGISTGGSGSSVPLASFRAPAHKHAHHLHSIPPREKSTRTLIIDHMLWVHGTLSRSSLSVLLMSETVGRTRFAQARAELGMTDRTGGPSSSNYAHRKRPEQYEEEDEVRSDGENAGCLRARAGGPGHPHNDDEDERQSRQDLLLARALRLRAEDLEKVVTSMLDQPPPIPPITSSEHILTPPASPRIKQPDIHRLPNGVRLRLALGTIINDLFARQAPPPPYRHSHSSPSSTPGQTPPTPITPSELPDALLQLATISGAFASLPNSPTRSTSSPYHQSYTPPPYQSHSPHQSFPNYSSPPQQRPASLNRPNPSPRTRALYAVGADPRTANAPPTLRCPRHLHTGCEICVDKVPQRQSKPGHSRSASNSTTYWKGMPGGLAPGGGGLTGWQDGSGIGSGLLLPGPKGSALRRKVPEFDSRFEAGRATMGSGSTKLSTLIPRFLRLSALAAAELGREARGEDEESDEEEHTPQGSRTPTPSPNRPTSTFGFSQGLTSEQIRMYRYAFHPSTEWYLLLAGLLTRAVLEGYLTGGWLGIQSVQCLLQVGLGVNEGTSSRRAEDLWDDDEEFAHFQPDELPSLADAVKILFPSLRSSVVQQSKGRAEEEYEREMLERLRKVSHFPVFKDSLIIVDSGTNVFSVLRYSRIHTRLCDPYGGLGMAISC